MVLLSVMSLGCVESQSAPKSIENPQSTIVPTQTQAKTIVLITASPAQMLPTINDMPDGSIKESETTNETHAEKVFALIRGSQAQALTYKLNKCQSIDEAQKNYNSIKNGYSNYKLTSMSLGEEGFGYSLADSIATIVFRKVNLVVTVELAGQFTTLQDAESYAKMVRV